MKRVKIFVATTKQYRMPEDEMYFPIHVGAYKKNDIGYQRDDVEDNISNLNPFFCELTALYWAWKNTDYDYIGLVHYRRHFRKHIFAFNKWNNILTYDYLKNYLDNIKIFVPAKRHYYIETLYSHYKHTHYASQLDETRKIIKNSYPSYLDSFDTTIIQTWGYMFNMMIMKKELLDSYCNWLFPILFQLRERLGEDGLSAFHARYYGRISEILFNVWLNFQIKTNQISLNEIKELSYIHMERKNYVKKIIAFLKAKFFGIKYEKSF